MCNFVSGGSDFIPSVVRDVLIWINEDISRPMSVEIVAKKAGYSKWHFQRLFSLATGCTVARYIRLQRLLTSSRLLRTTTKDMIDICMEVGFTDRQTFCRIFKIYFGITPSTFRSINIQEAVNLLRFRFGSSCTASDSYSFTN